MVRFWVELSEYVPVAVYCCVPALMIEAVAGVTAMDCRVTGGLVTVSVAVPEVLLSDAVMVALPAATPVARPALLMVAVAVLLDDQVTWVVRF